MSSSGAKSRLIVVRGVITKFYHGVESRALECSLEKINEFKSICEEYNSLVEERIDSLVSMDGTEEEIKRIESYVVKIKTVWDFFDSKVKMDNNACRNMPKIIINPLHSASNRKLHICYSALFRMLCIRYSTLF